MSVADWNAASLIGDVWPTDFLNVTYDGRPTQQNGLDIRPLFELH
jgi:hypothetical protein